ncbi:MAG: hypothetical protein Q7S57_04215 [bacterium]|nr:hypothetical protein [bacterium]
MSGKNGYCGATIHQIGHETFWGEAARIAAEVLNLFADSSGKVVVAVEFAPLCTNRESALADTIDLMDAIIVWAQDLSGSHELIATQELVKRNRSFAGKITITKEPGY